MRTAPEQCSCSGISELRNSHQRNIVGLVKQAVVPVAEDLAWVHLAPRGLLALRVGPAAQPHAQLLAALVVALKVGILCTTRRHDDA